MSTTLRTVAVYIPLITGSLSMAGSGSILYSIWTRRKTKLKDPQHRILGMMSIFDMFYSLCKALTFLLYPRGLGVPTFGNMATCSLQGFFTQFGYAAGTYNLVLSLYYYLTINRGMKPRDFARVLEKVLHGSVVTLHVSFAIAGASIGLFNPTPSFCYISPAPFGCLGNDDIPCERFGTTSPYFYEAFGQFWIQLAYVVIIITNLLIWLYVRKQEKQMQKYRMSCRTISTDDKFLKMKKSSKHARSVFIQSMLYVGAFVLSWSWATVFHLISWVGGISAFWPTLLINTFLPLQGFWNAFIYARPRYLRIRKKRQSLGFRQVVKLAFLPQVEGTTNLSQNASLGGRPIESSGNRGSITGASGTGATRSFLAGLRNLNSGKSSTASDAIRPGHGNSNLSDIEECNEEQRDSYMSSDSDSESIDKEALKESAPNGQNGGEEFIENEEKC